MPSNRERTVVFANYEKNGFIFRKLEFEGLSNKSVLDMHPRRKKEEIALFPPDILRGDEFLLRLDAQIGEAINKGIPLPVVRFADGEYWFYSYSLKCNGLYQQAESKAHIKESIPMHIKALKYVSDNGQLCPLIYKENTFPKRLRVKDIIRGNWKGGSVTDLLCLMAKDDIFLTSSNYTPFYVVYAYLSSKLFLRRIEGRKVCIVNAPINETNITNWFREQGVEPEISYVSIPEEFIATQWGNFKDEIIDSIPKDVDLCLVGAGIGALMACADISYERNCPSIDAGHILNLMNGRTGGFASSRLFIKW